MSLRIHDYPSGLQGLAAFCDVCGEQITKHGYVLWNSEDTNDWIVIHQATCDPGEPYDYSMDLDVEIVYLANSAGVDLEKAKGRARLLAEIGA